MKNIKSYLNKIKIILIVSLNIIIFIFLSSSIIFPQATEEWVARYNGPENNYDSAWGIALDSSGNIYVIGTSCDSEYISDYATIKYNSSGVEQWVATYDGPGNYFDAEHRAYVNFYGTGFPNFYCYLDYVEFTIFYKNITDQSISPQNANLQVKIDSGIWNDFDSSNVSEISGLSSISSTDINFSINNPGGNPNSTHQIDANFDLSFTYVIQSNNKQSQTIYKLASDEVSNQTWNATISLNAPLAAELDEYSYWIDDLDDFQSIEYEEEIFSLSEKGAEKARVLWLELTKNQKDLLTNFKSQLNKAPLDRILEYVYKKYKENYTDKSLIRDKYLS